MAYFAQETQGTYLKALAQHLALALDAHILRPLHVAVQRLARRQRLADAWARISQAGSARVWGRRRAGCAPNDFAFVSSRGFTGLAAAADGFFTAAGVGAGFFAGGCKEQAVSDISGRSIKRSQSVAALTSAHNARSLAARSCSRPALLRCHYT